MGLVIWGRGYGGYNFILKQGQSEKIRVKETVMSSAN